MKGIILAGGNGTRLYPLTKVINKHLLAIYDKPMIYYPLSCLMDAGITDICIIVRQEDVDLYKKLLGDGQMLGCKFTYLTQEKPEGISQAFIIAEKFIDNNPVCLILGDNIFYGENLAHNMRNIIKSFVDGGVIFAYKVKDPNRYGVVEFDKNNKVISIEEKPKFPKSNYAIPGIYFFDPKCIKYAKEIRKSDRGEYEITEIHNCYLNDNKLKVDNIDYGIAWVDTGTFTSLIEAGQYIKIIEERQNIKIGCIEEIAFKRGYIDKELLEKHILINSKTSYGEYLKSLI